MSDYQYIPNQEQWKEIPGFPGYEVSDHGKIRSYRKYLGNNKWEINHKPQRILKPAPSRSGKGYLFVRLSCDGAIHYLSVHTAVLIAFDGLPPAKMQCRHLDGNRLNNHYPNLSWGTPSQNGFDRSAHGTRAMGESHPSAKLTVNQVLEIRHLSSTGSTQNELIKLYGISQSVISNIILRKTWKHI